MSSAAAHESKRTRHACQFCRDRKARFSHRGAVRADRDHTLCFECFRAERERQRARQLAEVPHASPVMSPFAASRAFSERQITHRRAMLLHAERQNDMSR